MIDRTSDYNLRITTYLNQKQKLEYKQKYLPLLRLGLFLLFAFLCYKFLTTQTALYGILAILIFIIFLVITVIDSKLKKLIKTKDILLHINEMEIAVLAGDYSTFDSGIEFIDQSHDYSHDLDIFGEGSLFQYINRTATIFGKLQLADYFNNAFSYSGQVIPRQTAVNELSEMVDLRQKLQLIFHDEQIAESDKTEIIQWLESESPVKNLELLRILAYGLPALTLAGTVMSIFGIISFPSILIIIQLMIVFLYGKKTIATQNIITSKNKILNKYAQSLLLIENTVFISEYLKKLHQKLSVNLNQRPSKSIHSLSVILNYIDSNLNLLMAVILNGLFMFNLHLLLKVEKWKKLNRPHVPDWFEAIATLDALSSLANFRYNHPDFVFPEVHTEDFNFEALDLGHPLIPPDQRVVNDLTIHGWNQFHILTGANMSGKSTFLRTIGANYLLAMAGAPVCAKKLKFFPVEIHSSIRTSDSLVKNESYFYAELKRLKQIIDELNSGKQKLILLDEILKGTNSKDKQAGSIALIEQLLHFKSVGLFATHDLMLGELADRYPGHVNNFCFEIEITGDKMMIDYKLRKGVCKNLNATYLMKNMGILFKTK